jgi:hypothetical protein
VVEKSSPGNVDRHSNNCKICSHPHREDIERDFINWRSPAEIAKAYRLANRSNVYRHVQALNLFPKRQRNIRAALERIIERAGEVHVTAPSVVAAVQAYATLRGSGSTAAKPSTCTTCLTE